MKCFVISAFFVLFCFVLLFFVCLFFFFVDVATFFCTQAYRFGYARSKSKL